MAKPILKWAGGKRQIIDSLLNSCPRNIEEYKYHEPMVGGGALFFNVEPDEGSINDLNSRLINLYRVVRDNPDELVEQSKNFKHPESEPDSKRDYSDTNRKGKEIKNYYYQQREIFNNRPNGDNFDRIIEASLFLYLNRTCYNGLYRENKSGEFNVPIGDYKNPDWVRKKQIKEASEVLINIEINNKDFSYLENVDLEGTKNLIYFDPPYKPLSEEKNFTNYNSDDFGKKEQIKLINVINQLNKIDKSYIVVSNSGIMKEKYKNRTDLDVKTVKAKRSINSDGEKRGNVKEIIASTN